MSTLLKFYSFDKKGWRWLLSFSCTWVSFIKTGTINCFKFDKRNKRWLQFHRRKCYFVDKKPDWNVNLKFLEKRTEEFCLKQYNPSSNDIIIDIGAGVGTETFVFSNAAKNGRVYAIEAHPETYFSLSLLKEKNKLENVVISNIALSDKAGDVFIQNQQNHAANKILKNEDTGTKIKAITLDQYVKENNIEKIDFIKMNIEGAELDVIKGMEYTIKKTKYIAVSCHDFLFNVNATKIKDTVTDFLVQNGFRIEERNSGREAVDSWIYGKRNN